MERYENRNYRLVVEIGILRFALEHQLKFTRVELISMSIHEVDTNERGLRKADYKALCDYFNVKINGYSPHKTHIL